MGRLVISLSNIILGLYIVQNRSAIQLSKSRPYSILHPYFTQNLTVSFLAPKTTYFQTENPKLNPSKEYKNIFPATPPFPRPPSGQGSTGQCRAGQGRITPPTRPSYTPAPRYYASPPAPPPHPPPHISYF